MHKRILKKKLDTPFASFWYCLCGFICRVDYTRFSFYFGHTQSAYYLLQIYLFKTNALMPNQNSQKTYLFSKFKCWAYKIYPPIHWPMFYLVVVVVASLGRLLCSLDNVCLEYSYSFIKYFQFHFRPKYCLAGSLC